MSRILCMNTSCEISLKWTIQNTIDDISQLAQVLAWCRQVSSHYLSQHWHGPMSPYAVTKPQWVHVWMKPIYQHPSNITLEVTLKDIGTFHHYQATTARNYGRTMCIIYGIISTWKCGGILNIVWWKITELSDEVWTHNSCSYKKNMRKYFGKKRCDAIFNKYMYIQYILLDNQCLYFISYECDSLISNVEYIYIYIYISYRVGFSNRTNF